MIYCPLINHEFDGDDPSVCVHFKKPNECTFYKSTTGKCEAEVRDEKEPS